MLRKLPGDHTRDLVSTVPTQVVFRPVVVPTPAIVTILVALFRALAGVVRTVWRHPVACLAAAVPAGLCLLYGWRTGLLTPVAVLSGLTGWRFTHPASFSRWVGLRLRAWWVLVWVYRRHWQPVMVVSGLAKHIGGREYLPRLLKVTCTPTADMVAVKMLAGQSADAWQERADNLAHGFARPQCRVTVGSPGRVVLTFPRRDVLATPIPALPIPSVPVVASVPIGLREDGAPYLLKLHGTHVLVAGATGAGKGSWLWSAVRGLLPAAAAGLVELWALDPKRMELSYGRSLFGPRYAADPADCADLLEAAVTIMQGRADRYAGVQRTHVPTVDDPFVVVLVDEVAFLTAYQTDRKLKERTLAALATLTTQGRAVGIAIVAALQDPRKEVLSIRNLFPDKIALRLDEPSQVDLVLGDGARDRGALADQISSYPQVGAGVGYVRLEADPEPVRVRAAYVTDTDILAMVRCYAGTGEAR
ncbi:FtsK/SpoIIIE domain-containing protein [Sphaerisporangium rubeum]|uniref:S-DNA-T family DNA segregation ATPase FtsK/SpoIIIE n=1 Tax=Sphaerisporangium rubeum TaxID=321317 RepID=A0A7X0IKR1_9ACTN|nr:FtsK/SpoIIIE domain-containing protein [Sphaerisporangium rubeum]MBB6476770.1 S-DNA-T family DNA segregation ATPase FtsK/SpoIIIE [Sphaerisporangium rubeum]